MSHMEIALNASKRIEAIAAEEVKYAYINASFYNSTSNFCCGKDQNGRYIIGKGLNGWFHLEEFGEYVEIVEICSDIREMFQKFRDFPI